MLTFLIGISALAGGISALAGEVCADALAQSVRELTRKALRAHGYSVSYSNRVAGAILTQSARNRIDPLLLAAIIQHESSFSPRKIGRAGEIGLMQVKPSTAAWVARTEGLQWNGKKTLRTPERNIEIGATYLARLREQFQGRPVLYLAAYNMGPGNVKRCLSPKARPKTVKYVRKVLRNYERLALRNRPVAACEGTRTAAI